MLSGEARASSAEQLMRSRYTAFVLKHQMYLLQTWHESTRPATLDLADDTTRWESLTVHHSEAGQPEDTTGTVEFTARFRLEGKRHQMRENSTFIRTETGWKYVQGEQKSP
ncbi:preprotein translocase SecA [Deinococcus cellulosilyticus NBRC 106333 = KACC 11606]|uniref:Preprotein translocase SecA n=1 Tax=Deinococcus cellulosilyticus (strain DSM 18568 / NBRC 106333 / KACC 11606 / 5516J-15) TaxID=1223518 RepID=A0A511NA48_DEIC1|nr:preprotein translocase SecA [Deinococcus cellulosilyticus NBRC 106333 = KACC 11606]